MYLDYNRYSPSSNLPKEFGEAWLNKKTGLTIKVQDPYTLGEDRISQLCVIIRGVPWRGSGPTPFHKRLIRPSDDNVSL
jgi:hypothetical protein